MGLSFGFMKTFTEDFTLEIERVANNSESECASERVTDWCVPPNLAIVVL